MPCTTPSDVRKRVDELGKKLNGKAFLGGAVPSAQDAKEFEELLGGNMYLARWSKHMASFTKAERAAWGATVSARPATVVSTPISSSASSSKPAGGQEKEEEKPSLKKDTLRDIEKRMQARWETEKTFEVDPPEEGEEDTGKFMATFPYPYMNGMLHLGHAFSLLKADFAVAYHRLLGKRSLFPFGFHCTGMPIQAAANKLRRDYEMYGSPYPKFPCGAPFLHPDDDSVGDSSLKIMWSPPTCTGQVPVKDYTLFVKAGNEFKEVGKVENCVQEVERKMRVVKVVTGLEAKTKYVFRVVCNLEDGTSCHPSKESEEIQTSAKIDPNEKKGKKKGPAKIAQKSGDAPHQWDIMRGMGVPVEDIPAFVDPMKWLEFFPPQGKDDLKLFGVHADFRRSFITTDVNPFYDAFIRWQFRKLQAGDRIAFGKRPTIYSEADKQACMDHDRAEGEGKGHQEYTAVKVKVLDPLPEVLKDIPAKNIYLLCATLRPETMVGQTNCWVLPEGKYGCFDAGSGDAYVCTYRAARNMSFQDIMPEWGKVTCYKEFTGQEIMGAALKAPRSVYDKIHLLPLLTIKMDKGTGVVTSVPADSPDDFAAFRDLQNPKKREYYGIKDEWVVPFDTVPLIDVEIDGVMQTKCAQYLVEKLDIQSQKDTEKLAQAKEIAYNAGFYRGVMSIGEFKGMPVQQAKTLCRESMIKEKLAFTYHEPEALIKSRSGDECVVALIDQWYLKYGDEKWRNEVIEHVKKTMDCFSPGCSKAFEDQLMWLKEWACSRSFGLGTRIPWDEQFVIESLSDSTIYMAYYTMAKFFHGENNLDGSKPNPYGIKPDQLTDEVFDYILLGKALPKCSIPEKTLRLMRREFEYWYPMDLRVSGKDLIQNHLIMCLYNHAAIWEGQPEMWPRSMYTNGWVLVDGQKMSKSLGNFLTIRDAVERFSTDATRLACANAGDSMEDANFEVNVANNAILKLHNILETATTFMKTKDSKAYRYGDKNRLFTDRWFANEMGRLITDAATFYERMRFKEALRCCYFDFIRARDMYLDACPEAPHGDLIFDFFQNITIMLSIICPHVCEELWTALGNKGSVLNARFPKATFSEEVIKQGTYLLVKTKEALIEKRDKDLKRLKKKAFSKCNVYIATRYPQWKIMVIEELKRQYDAEKKTFPNDVLKAFDPKSPSCPEIFKSKGAQVGKFAAEVKKQAADQGIEALDEYLMELPYDEAALLSEHKEFIRGKLKVAELNFYKGSDEGVPDPNTQENAVPGKPSAAFHE